MKNRLALLAGAGVVSLVAALAACNALLGVDDVTLGSPDASCKVGAHFPLITSNPATSSLIHYQDGTLSVPSLLLLLNNDAKPDRLILRLYSNLGEHGNLDTPGTYSLSVSDAKWETCGLCVFIEADYDPGIHDFAEWYLARSGSLQLDNTTGRLAGTLSNLELRHVLVTSSPLKTTETNDGCITKVDQVIFDLPYEVDAGTSD